MPTMVYVWIAAIVLFAIAEAATVSLVSIWFCGGALLAMLTALLGASVAVQYAVFVLASGVLLALFLPLARTMLRKKHTATNADRLLGRSVLVTEPIDNLHETGAVRVNGVLWTAVSTSGAPIPVDTLVTIERIAGAKLYVSPAPADAACAQP